MTQPRERKLVKVPYYPVLIDSNKLYADQFTKEFSILVEKNLKKKMVAPPNLETIQKRFCK